MASKRWSGLGLALGVALGVAAVPLRALADEVTVALAPGVLAPVGPPGSAVVGVERATLNGTRYAVVRVRQPGLVGRCGQASERVSAWGQAPGEGWRELANEVFSRCPALAGNGVALQVRARMIEPALIPGATEPELHVRLVDPRLAPGEAQLIRFHRAGSRLVQSARGGLLAAYGRAESMAPPVDPGQAFTEAPFATAQRGAIRARFWLRRQGTTLTVTAALDGLDADASPGLHLVVSDPGISTATLEGRDGAAGRSLERACRSPGPGLRCSREGATHWVTVETDLATLLWRGARVSEVAVWAGVEGAPGLSTDPDRRLRAASLGEGFDLLDGAAPAVAALCRGQTVGRVGADRGLGAMGGIVTCGARCVAGLCEHVVGVDGAASRLVWRDQGGGLCVDVEGAGREAFAGCRPEAPVRLVGSLHATGWALVIAVAREAAGASRAELWALPTASARWQRIYESEADPRAVTRVAMLDGRPTLCREGAACTPIALALESPAEPPGTTQRVAETLRQTGLWAHRE
ncbi:MAG: hypothetical protein JNK72_02000 [Myxococcales bacterium]|nr:hypothetical protein [Myxococcales bacterium]